MGENDVGDKSAYPADLERYSRQMLFAPIGVDGQKRLKHSVVTLVGCGALGSVIANTLVRAGIGALKVIDRDFIEINNLQRQVLFDEHDISQNLPKAEAAVRKLRRVNSSVEIEAEVADFNPSNAVAYCVGADLILDGTDNLETRFLINDVAVKHGLPWVYGACIGAEGLVMPIIPGRTACLRCVWHEPPPPGTTPTCDTVGVLASIVGMVAGFQAQEAMKILCGREDELCDGLTTIDAWSGRLHRVDMRPALDQGDCVCCKQGRYEFLEGDRVAAATTLCGRNAVQILPLVDVEVRLKSVFGRLPARSKPKVNEYMLKFALDGYGVTLFADGRAIVQGTSDPAEARGFLAKYVGS